MRLGTGLLGILAIAGGILYVKQDSLLVRATFFLRLFPLVEWNFLCLIVHLILLVFSLLRVHIHFQYFPEIGSIPRRPANNPRGYRSPEERQIPFESHMIPCSDGVHIHAWFLPAPLSKKQDQQNAPTILFFHGNAGNIGLRLPNAIQMLQHLSSNILLVEYRGYGNSDSVPPTERGLKLDAEAALTFCLNNPNIIDSSKLFVFGRSLGGAVAFHLTEYAEAHRIPLAGVMVENTFTSISSMVDHLMPFLTPIKALVLTIGWNSVDIVPRLRHTPMFFLAGARDEIVPHSHMRELHSKAIQNGDNNNINNLVEIHVIPDGTHNESWMQGGSAYWDSIRSFMEAALQQPMRMVDQGHVDPVSTNTIKSGAKKEL